MFILFQLFRKTDINNVCDLPWISRGHVRGILVDLMILMLISSFNIAVQGAVIPQSDIDSPCLRHPTTSNTTLFPPLLQQLSNTITRLRVAKTKLVALRNYLIQEKYLVQDEFKNLTDRTCNISGLPLVFEERHLTEDNFIAALNMNYQELSIYILYTIKAEQDMGKVYDRILAAKIGEVKNRLYSLLCQIDQILRGQGSPMTTVVISSQVTKEVTENCTNGKLRAGRNYILSQQVTKYLSILETSYNAFMATVE